MSYSILAPIQSPQSDKHNRWRQHRESHCVATAAWSNTTWQVASTALGPQPQPNQPQTLRWEQTVAKGLLGTPRGEWNTAETNMPVSWEVIRSLKNADTQLHHCTHIWLCVRVVHLNETVHIFPDRAKADWCRFHEPSKSFKSSKFTV